MARTTVEAGDDEDAPAGRLSAFCVGARLRLGAVGRRRSAPDHRRLPRRSRPYRAARRPRGGALAMCGIAGIFHPDVPKPIDRARVKAMADVLAHRGPDGSGVWTAPGVGVGHRRLSIIDLRGGAQPMLTPDEKVAITFKDRKSTRLKSRP